MDTIITNAKHMFIPGRGDMFVTDISDDKDYKHLLNKNVSINGHVRFVKSIEYIGAHKPFRNCSEITLTVN